MMHRLFVSMTIAGLVCGYMAMLYALMRIVSSHRSFLFPQSGYVGRAIVADYLNFSARVTSDIAAWLLWF